MQQTLLRSADGNPLFAEEYIRMLRDRGLLRHERRSGGSTGQTSTFRRPCRGSSPPGSTRSNRTRRRCSRQRGRGEGLLARVGRRDRRHLRWEPRSDSTRSSARSSSAATPRVGRGRDGVRGAPRARARRRVRSDPAGAPRRPACAGGAVDRVARAGASEDRAEMLAHHYVAALELTRAAGGDSGGLEEPTRLALREAGSRAYALSALAGRG